jgi:glycosyltransferase involved in cell wall biosynthesis
MQVLLRAPFDTFSGYGNDAVDIAIWLRRAGVNVVPYPISLIPGLPREFLQLLEKAPLTRPDVLLMFAAPITLRPEVVEGFDGPIAVWTMWERSAITLDDVTSAGYWDGEGWPAWSTWLNRFLVTCPMNVDAFRALDPDLDPVVLPCGVDPDEGRWPIAKRSLERPVRYLWVGTGAARKDPFLLLESWRDLKAERPDFDGQLTLHVSGPGLHPKLVDTYGPDVTVSHRPLQHEALVQMYQDHDVLISVSRGEGNNKPAMEFMATGGTVIATDWAGHQNWLHPDATYALPGTLIPTHKGVPSVQEFHADRTALTDLLLHTWANRSEVRDKGMVAANWIRSACSWEHVIARLLPTLNGMR